MRQLVNVIIKVVLHFKFVNVSYIVKISQCEKGEFSKLQSLELFKIVVVEIRDIRQLEISSTNL